MRGIAIVMMVIYHFTWDLYFFRFIPFETLITPFWKYFQRFIASNFITLVGVSLAVGFMVAKQANSRQREPRKEAIPWWRNYQRLGWIVILSAATLVAVMANTPQAKLQRTIAIVYLIVLAGAWIFRDVIQPKKRPSGGFPKALWRGLWIFGWGMVVSASVAIGQSGSVDFGVLHLIGFSTIVAYPFLTFRWINVGLWLVFNMVGYYLIPARADDIWFVWLGWRPEQYFVVDYFPIFPWFGVVLLGIAVGNFAYGPEGRQFFLPDISHWFPSNVLQWLGKRSLFIYLIHQPLMFGLFQLLFVLGVL